MLRQQIQTEPRSGKCHKIKNGRQRKLGFCLSNLYVTRARQGERAGGRSDLMGDTKPSGAKLQSKKFQKSELTMEVGGWVQVSLGKKMFVISSQNSPIPDILE